MDASNESSVCAVVVTHNRKELLIRCLSGLAGQTRPVDEIVVVDNASTDDTPAHVRQEFPGVALLLLPENVGGAGGFNRGIAWGHARGHGWLWLMDDDTLPEPGALEALLEGGERAPRHAPPLVLASQVLWKDGSLHPMNRPWPRRRPANAPVLDVNGLVSIRAATFVSVALRREAMDRFGLPLSHYFIWTDDIEYTARILRTENGYLVQESRVCHWTDRAHSPVSASGSRFYYHVRNSLLLLRGTSLFPLERVGYLRYWLGTLGAYLIHNRFRRDAVSIVVRGLRDGFSGGIR